MRSLFIASVFLLASHVDALAIDLPDYPVEAICSSRGDRFGSVAKKFCISEEQYARDRLKYGSEMPDGNLIRWDALPNEAQTDCTNETKFSLVNRANSVIVSPYVHLEECVVHAYRILLTRHPVPDAHFQR